MVSTGSLPNDRSERQRKSIALETLLRKNKRYDPKKAKDEKYYHKAKLLRSYHKMLKRETAQNEAKTKEDFWLNESDLPNTEPSSNNEEDADEVDSSAVDESVDSDHEVCKFFSKGKGCRAGASCQFKHQGEPARKIPLCKFYTSRTGCQKGSRCKFKHDGTPQTVPQEKAAKKSLMMKIWEQNRVEADAARIAKEHELAQKRADSLRRKQERIQHTKNHLRKTSRGQPLMKGVMSSLLSKIVRQTEASL